LVNILADAGLEAFRMGYFGSGRPKPTDVRGTLDAARTHRTIRRR
jgi:hypothetical protein